VKSPAQALAELERKVRTRLRGWALGEPFAEITLGLGAPTAARASADLHAFTEWVSQWREAAEGPGGLGELLEWHVRRWPGLGEQRIPVRLVVRAREDALAATGTDAEFAVLRERAQRLLAWCGEAVGHSGSGSSIRAAPGTAKRGGADGDAGTDGDSRRVAESVGRLLPRIAGYSAGDFDRLLRVLRWLAENPSSGLFVRALPIEGVDTKWLEGHRSAVAELLTAVGIPDLGLRERTRLVRVRVLERSALDGEWPRGVDDAALPLDALMGLVVKPGATVLVVENLTSLLGLSQAEAGAVDIALAGDGRAAVELARVLPWLRQCRVLYWGDLDTHGMEILARFREACPQTESVLMDARTLAEFGSLGVEEPVQADSRPEQLPSLIPEEKAVMRQLFADRVRLEQERLPWPHVHAQLKTTRNNCKELRTTS
jgi:hypothetical protein